LSLKSGYQNPSPCPFWLVPSLPIKRSECQWSTILPTYALLLNLPQPHWLTFATKSNMTKRLSVARLQTQMLVETREEITVSKANQVAAGKLQLTFWVARLERDFLKMQIWFKKPAILVPRCLFVWNYSMILVLSELQFHLSQNVSILNAEGPGIL
jgi:hypothetical protein